MRPISAVLAALALCAPAASHAQPVSTPAGAGPDTYFQVHLGAYLPQSDDLDALDAGYDVGGTFGARFTPYASVEGELAYVHASGRQSAIDLDVDQRLSMFPVTASLRLRLASKSAEVFVLGGGGLYFASMESTVTGPPPLGGGATSVRTSDSSTTFGYHVGGGLAVNLSPTMQVGAEVRRTFVDGKFDGVETGLDGVRVALTLGYHF